MASEEKDMSMTADSETGRMTRIVRDYKVFWTTVPIELPGEGGVPVKIGVSIALVGTDADEPASGNNKDGPSVFDKLYELAGWLTSRDVPDVRFEIRKLENFVFYTPDDLKTKRKNYVVTVQIRHSGKFDSPLDERQVQVLGEFEVRLKEIGSPRDHWKERVNNQY